MGTIHQLPVIPASFPSAVEALDWYASGIRVSLLEDVQAPPVDTTGNAFVDAYTAMVFAALTKMPWPHMRIGHLSMKAQLNDRYAEHCRSIGEDSYAVEYDCIAAILRGWAEELRGDVLAALDRLTEPA